MILGMRRISPADLLRIASGLSLLLLVATEEKVCPWLVSAPAESDPAPQPAKPGPDAPEPDELPPLLAGNTLPDALAPRWGVESVARNGTAPIIGAGAAVAAGTDGTPGTPTPVATADLAPSRPAFRAAAPPKVCETPSTHVARRTLLTSINPTGPPRA